MYMRWLVDPAPEIKARAAVRSIVARQKEARAHVVRLRRHLESLVQKADALGLLPERPRLPPEVLLQRQETAASYLLESDVDDVFQNEESEVEIELGEEALAQPT